MKFKKFLSGFLFGFGCVIVFIGLAAMILPMVGNDQLHLVLSSFAQPSQNPIVNLINMLMTYALGNCYLMMVIGASVALLGALSMLFIRPKEDPNPVTAKGYAPYIIAENGAAMDDMRIWRASKAPAAKENNPFADTSFSHLPTPKTAAIAPKEKAERPFASFAPVAQPARAAAVTMVSSPYARPFAADPFAEWGAAAPNAQAQDGDAAKEEIEDTAAAPVPAATTISASPAAPAFAPVPASIAIPPHTPTLITANTPLMPTFTPSSMIPPPASIPISATAPAIELLDPTSPNPDHDPRNLSRIVIHSTFSAPAPAEDTAPFRADGHHAGSFDASPADFSENTLFQPAIPKSPINIKSTMGKHS